MDRGPDFPPGRERILMKARCPECSATYDVQVTNKPRRARCKCGATFLLAEDVPFDEPVLEELEAPRAVRSAQPVASAPAPPRHSVKPTRTLSKEAVTIGVAMIVFNFVWGALTGTGVVAAAGDWGDGRGSVDATLFSMILLSLSFPILVAGIGMILSQAWAWWLALVLQGGGLLMSAKFLWSYLSRLNWDHPLAEDVLLSTSLVYGIPFLAAFAMISALCMPSVRLACGVKGRPLPARRRKTAGTPRRAR